MEIRPKFSLLSRFTISGKYHWDASSKRAFVTMGLFDVVEVDWSKEGSIICTYVKRTSLFRNTYYYHHFSKWEDLEQKRILLNCIQREVPRHSGSASAFRMWLIRKWFGRP